MEEKDDSFLRLGGCHSALLSCHSHRGNVKASNCENFAIFRGMCRDVTQCCIWSIATEIYAFDSGGVAGLTNNNKAEKAVPPYL